MMKRLLWVVYIFYSILILISCNGQLAGGGTETTNGISGTVSCLSNVPTDHNGIIVAIFSIDYRPDSASGFAESTRVEIDGAFEFNEIPDKRYNLFVWDTVNYTSTYLQQLPSDTILGTIQLKDSGVLKTTRPSPAVGDPRYIQYKLVIPGTPFYIKESKNILDYTLFLPPGEFRIELGLLPKDTLGNNPVWVNQQQIVTVNPALGDTAWLVIP